MTHIVWRSEDGALAIHHRTIPSVSLVKLLDDTLWGTHEVKYRVRNIANLIDGIADPHILTLEDEKEGLVGGYVAGRKHLRVGQRVVPAVHIAMLAVDPRMAGRGYGGLLAREAKRALFSLMGDEGIIYLFVEATNAVSSRLHRTVGYDDFFTAKTHVFARLFPEIHHSVRHLRPDERDDLVRRLAALYSDHAGLDFEQTLSCERYHVLESEGRIVAGMQASEMHWSLEELEGPAGRFALNVLPGLPLVAQFFDPKRFKFLRLGNIYLEAGSEPKMTVLLEAVLASYQRHFGMVFIDPRSEISQRFIAATSFGLPKALSEFGVNVLVATQGLTPSEEEWLKRHPVHFSEGDMI